MCKFNIFNQILLSLSDISNTIYGNI